MRPHDRRTREQRKADDSALIAAGCLGAAALLLAVGLLLTGADAKDREPPVVTDSEVSAAEAYNPAWDKPATEYAYFVEYYAITIDDRVTLEHIVEGEAGGESYEGKLWVATCLLNAMRKDNMSADEVRAAYQYAGWSDDVSEDTARAVSQVFDFGDVTHETVLWFYAPKWCESQWHEAQQFVAEIGGHRFFCPREA